MRLGLVTLALAASVNAACTQPTVRMEWSQLSSGQKSAYVAAVYALTQRPLSGQLENPATISFYDFVETHTNNAYWAHGNAQFYPYHRAMMHQWDLALQTVGWTSGSVYWDWSAMSQNWWTSDIFSSQYFGAVSSSDPDNCVLDGQFAKGKYAVSPNPSSGPNAVRKVSGNPTCLRRCGSVGSAVTDATTITAPLLTATSYVQFHGDDSSNYHAVGHETMGGANCDFGNPSFSPNDPLFYLHHVFVDKVWWRWQQSCPSYLTDYEGTLASSADPTSDGVDNIAYATLNLDSWSWWTVGDVLNPQGGVLCYTYSASGGDLTIPRPASCKAAVVPSVVTTAAATSKATGTSSEVSPNPETTGTAGTAVVPTGPSSANKNSTGAVSDLWMTQLLNSLVQTKSFVFNVPSAAGSGSINRRDLPFKRDDSTTPSTTPLYTITTNPDTSHLVSLNDGTNIPIPAGYTVYRVYESNVQATNDATGKPAMFRPPVTPIPYVPAACAPVNVTPGSHPCYLAAPPRVSMKYSMHMQMDWTRTTNNDNLVAMQVDAFNYMRFLLLLSFLVAACHAVCTTPLVRSEWSQLTAAQKQLYADALVALYKRPLSNQVLDPTKMAYHDFVQTHVRNAQWTHGNAQFYPYHRALMHQFELAMHSTGVWPKTLGVPYWDWPAMSQNWWTSDVFTYLGAATSEDVDSCVVDGPFAKGNYTIAPGLETFTRPVGQGGDATCLRRCAQVGVALTDATVISDSIKNSTNYIEFHGDDTSNYHGIGHVTLGGMNCGDMANGLFSTNDPLFFVHHAIVDKTWWRFQSTCPFFKLDYEGTLIGPEDPISNGKDAVASADLFMDSWTWWKVSDVLDTQGSLLCYTYSKSAGDLPVAPLGGCPPVTSAVPPLSVPSASVPPVSVPSVLVPSVLSNNKTSVPPPQPPPQTPVQPAKNGPSLPVSPPLAAIAPRDNPTIKRYTTTPTTNGTTVILHDGTKIHVPALFRLHHVFESRVQAVDKVSGTPQMFYRDSPAIPYVAVPCAVEVAAGTDPCFLSKPVRLSLEAVTGMRMCWTEAQNNDNLSAMQLDAFNCECGTRFSPSQMKYHP
ncbi:hypothetical protein HDU98_004875 [Podochytrium sp. JEL0797]|nr:hypothetical protein HDU98_004875 [Podochytrium sp. JEL0797]